METPFEKLLALLEEPARMKAAAEHMEWYMRTYCPVAARDDVGQTTSALTKLAHDLFVCDAVGEQLEKAMTQAQAGSLTTDQLMFVTKVFQAHTRQVKLPATFVKEKADVTARTSNIWVAARESGDLSAFPAALDDVLTLARTEAVLLGANQDSAQSMYDALLGNFEPALSTKHLLEVLGALKDKLVPLRREIRERTGQWVIPPNLRNMRITEEQNFVLANAMADALGFDRTRGGVAKTQHPFCSTGGPNDVQITTRYVPNELLAGFFGAAHETGHALYEQGVPTWIQAHLTPGFPVSLGLHESQSRLFENLVCRSPHALPGLSGLLWSVLPLGTRFSNLARFVNLPTDTPIRVESSELDYNLHIVMRVELELEMLGGLKAGDVPERFNALMKEYLGITPPDLAHGAWQDIHWSAGLIGYFGTYTLGNLASAQLFATFAKAEPSWKSQFSTGDFGPLKVWLQENVWERGFLTTLNVALVQATGQQLDPQHWLDYIEAKYAELDQVAVAV